MTLHEILPLVLAFATFILITAVRIERHARRAPRAYRCKELVADTSLAVTYRDAPMVECSRNTKLLVHGECVPLCPVHHKPMTQID